MVSLPLSEVATGICSASASCHQLGGCARGAHPAAGHDHRALGRLHERERGQDAGALGLGPERRHPGEHGLDQRLELRFLGIDLAFIAAKLQMHRPRAARDRDPERLADHVGKARHVVDGGIELGHRLERRQVVDLLVDLAELGLGLAPAGECDHRRMGEPGIAQAGRQIERADHLRHADAGPSRCARIAVRHIGGGFLPMGMDARDGASPLQLRKGAAQDSRHHEQMGDPIALEHLGQAFGPGHFPIVSEHGWFPAD